MKFIIYGLTLLLLQSCSDYLEFSPYVIDVDRQDLTEKELVKISNKNTSSFFPFSFVVLSDTHAYYRDLQDVIPYVNRYENLSFVLIAGDLTDLGLLKEYEKGNDLFKKFKVPYMTVIGNHDALSNGKHIYREMYGEYNYSFEFNNVKFIFFNSNKQEFNENVPDFDWLQNQLTDVAGFQHVIMMSHISIMNSIFSDEKRTRFFELVSNSDVSLVINGHGHNYEYHEFPRADGGKTIYLINGSVDKRVFNFVDVSANAVDVIKRSF